MEREAMKKYLYERLKLGNTFEEDCYNIEFILDNCDIEITPNNRFFVKTNTANLQSDVYWSRSLILEKEIKTPEVLDGEKTRAFTGNFDFSHTSPFWADILHLGIFGIKERLNELFTRANDEKSKKFYTGCIRVYEAALRFLRRTAELALSVGKIEMAEGLQNLSQSRPRNLYERLQTVFIFYTLQHNIEATLLRTLGRLDSLFFPYFQLEEKEYATKLFEDFINEIDRLEAPSNIPFALGGTDETGKSLINPLSYLLLDIYGKANTINTKLHILYDDTTPDDFAKQAFRYIRAGKNSIVFISNITAINALKKLGATHKDAVDYHVVGCYECGAAGELTCSCNARVNIPKALEITLNNGVDTYTGIRLADNVPETFDSFESLFAVFEKVLLSFTEKALAVTDAWERKYPLLHASPFLSSTYPSALEKCGDLYCDYAAKYNNSSINALGLATAVDSLVAIRKLVYTDKKRSLHELKKILRNDWKNEEILRLTIKNKYPKYGTGNESVDEIAKRIVKVLAEYVNGKKNTKGGVWRLGTFSIDWRWDFGRCTHATPDGRKAGETLSQNTSASFGADKNGPTAHLLSVSSFSHTLTPNGSIADIDLHESAVQSENGINAMLSTLKSYFDRQGLAVHYNVLNMDTLMKAKNDPSAYPNLQVRLCGWNVLFSSLSDAEKDEFIKRFQKKESV